MSLSQLPFTKHNCQAVYSSQQVLANETRAAQTANIAMYELMEQAGEAAFRQLQRRWPKVQHILLLCGQGNNGGDGFIVGRLAQQAGMTVTLLLTCSENQLKGDAYRAFQAMLDAGVKQIFTDKLTERIAAFQGGVIVDALFGIGFYGELSLSAQQWVATINQHKAAVLSIDIPSGLSANTGYVDDINAVIATVTVTFMVYKQGLLTARAADFVGEIILEDLALGAIFQSQVPSHSFYQPQATLINAVSPLQKRWPTSHKGSIGQILAIGGNVGMPGAIRLASEAALRCGAALVAVCCHPDNHALVLNGRPELMLAPSKIDILAQSRAMTQANVVLIGPGLGQQSWSKAHLTFCLQTLATPYPKSKTQPIIVVDADALTLLAQQPQHCDQWVLTPHPKEAASLLQCSVNVIEADRFHAVRAIAKKYGGICVLKGAGSLISDGEQVVINSSGNAGMASGGMGDVLSGIIAAFLLQADHYFAAVCLAVYIHGAAGDIIAEKHGQRGMLASDLFAPLQQLVNKI